MNFIRKKRDTGLINKNIRVRIWAGCLSLLRQHACLCVAAADAPQCNCSASVLRPRPTLVVTMQIGPYSVQVDALIAEGGFASVYRVTDPTTRKVIPVHVTF